MTEVRLCMGGIPSAGRDEPWAAAQLRRIVTPFVIGHHDACLNERAASIVVRVRRTDVRVDNR